MGFVSVLLDVVIPPNKRRKWSCEWALMPMGFEWRKIYTGVGNCVDKVLEDIRKR